VGDVENGDFPTTPYLTHDFELTFYKESIGDAFVDLDPMLDLKEDDPAPL